MKQAIKLAIAGDSAGAELADTLASHLGTSYEVSVLSHHPDSTDELYANLCDRVCTDLKCGKFDRAVLVCGTGIGVCISTNKVPAFVLPCVTTPTRLNVQPCPIMHRS